MTEHSDRHSEGSYGWGVDPWQTDESRAAPSPEGGAWQASGHVPPGSEAGAWQARRQVPPGSETDPWRGVGGPDPHSDPWRDPWQATGHPQPWGPSAAGQTDTLGMPAVARRGPRVGTLVAVSLVVALVAGGLGAGATLWYVDQRGGTTTDAPISLDQAPAGNQERPEGSIPAVSRALLPSVVSIQVGGQEESGTGSGFIIEGGYVVTNNHVVEAAGNNGRTLQLAFHDGNTASARVVGNDPTSDIAVLEPRGVSGLKPASLGNSEDVVVGDNVIAIGSPLGLDGSVTSGIVSATDRPVMAGGRQSGDASYINGIQTDAPINPGNSGGPLVNMRGQVVGVNSAIATLGNPIGGGSGNIGVGFAIPVNKVQRVAEQIINQGYATHPVIGAKVEINSGARGARIAQPGGGSGPAITPNGPADRVGLRPGDLIVRLDGQQIRSAKELIVAIRAHDVGETVDLTFRRDSRERTVSVTLDSSRGAGDG